MNKLDPFEELISKKLQDHRVDFSYDSWNAIEEKLPKTTAKPNTFSFVAIGVIIIVSSIILISTYQQNKTETISNPSIIKELTIEEPKELINKIQLTEKSNNSQVKNRIKPSKSLKNNSEEKVIIDANIKTEQETHDTHINSESIIVNSDNRINQEIEITSDLAEIDSNLFDNTPTPIAEFTVSKKIICSSESVKFFPIEKENSSYFWDFNDGSTSNEISPTHQFNSSGIYKVILKTTNNTNVTALSNEISITVNESPEIDFLYERLVEDGVPQILFTPNYIFNNTIEWDFGDGENSISEKPQHNFYTKGTYLITLKQTNEYNCLSTITKPLEIKENFNLYAPNSFTPDGDGINDTFIPESLKLMNVEFIMTIYNKQGKLIYKTKNINQPWDGFNQNTGEKCIQGSYIWIIQLINKLGQNEQYKGPLLLLD